MGYVPRVWDCGHMITGYSMPVSGVRVWFTLPAVSQKLDSVRAAIVIDSVHNLYGLMS